MFASIMTLSLCKCDSLIHLMADNDVAQSSETPLLSVQVLSLTLSNWGNYSQVQDYYWWLSILLQKA